jgi:hypothetical protein
VFLTDPFTPAALAFAPRTLRSLLPCTFLHIASQAASTRAWRCHFRILSKPLPVASTERVVGCACTLACGLRSWFLAWILLTGTGVLSWRLWLGQRFLRGAKPSSAHRIVVLRP